MEGEWSKLVIVSGLSGAGRTTALKALEDLGFYCVDNLPIGFVESFLRYCKSRLGDRRIAVGIYARDKDEVASFVDLFPKLEGEWRPALIFLEASPDVLVRRFKETRRHHPLKMPHLLDAIEREKEILKPMKELAWRVVDTSFMNSYGLRRLLFDIFGAFLEGRLRISVTSFGFKYGIPSYLDMLFDVRGLPNPHYQEELRDLTGLDRRVVAFVFRPIQSRGFLRTLWRFVGESIDVLKLDGRLHINIGVGCTGGVHRSVAVAEWLARRIFRCGYRVSLYHRELGVYKDVVV